MSMVSHAVSDFLPQMALLLATATEVAIILPAQVPAAILSLVQTM